MGYCTYYCNTCMSSCNSCNDCEDGVTLCEREQHVYKYLGQFKFGSTCLETNTDFITAASWNNLLSYISRAYAQGTTVNGGTPTLPRTVEKDKDEMEASMYNTVVNALNGLGSTSSLNNNMRPDIDDIYGSYFSGIETYINSKWLLKRNQCDSCNTECISCNKCDVNRCMACMGCDTYCDSGQCGSEE